jgi:hypothetical protein
MPLDDASSKAMAELRNFPLSSLENQLLKGAHLARVGPVCNAERQTGYAIMLA